ncbi:hypothetical protein N9H60_04465, partial [Flavimaricola sp.]
MNGGLAGNRIIADSQVMDRAADTSSKTPTDPRLGPLLQAIADRRDDLIALTQDLIRIPTLNPPGENYRLICEY